MLDFTSKHLQINRAIEEKGYIYDLFRLKWVLGATFLNAARAITMMITASVIARLEHLFLLCLLRLIPNDQSILGKQ